MIELWGNNAKTGFDLPQTVPTGQLGEVHYAELLSAFAVYGFMITVVTIDACLHASPGNEIHELQENIPAFEHG